MIMKLLFFYNNILLKIIEVMTHNFIQFQRRRLDNQRQSEKFYFFLTKNKNILVD